jgi:hypothetical protein
MSEIRGAILRFRRQRDPQLRRVQALSIDQRILGMNDAPTGRHQIHLAGMDDLLVAQAVAMQDFTLDHPGEGLQPDVRVGADMHAVVRREGDRADMVEEAPGTNHTLLAIGQGAPNEHVVAKVGAAGFDSDNGAHGLALLPGSRVGQG